jgi:hypothetical protein
MAFLRLILPSSTVAHIAGKQLRLLKRRMGQSAVALALLVMLPPSWIGCATECKGRHLTLQTIALNVFGWGRMDVHGGFTRGRL